MKLARIVGLAACAFCIISLMVAAVSAADTLNAKKGGQNSPGQNAGSIQAYTMSQTLSDEAQQNTLAFDALAFITGDGCSDTFLPPGKVADYAGFQYLRDNDKTQMGHNTDFVTRTADNVLVTLNDDQLAQFIALSKTEAPLSTQYGLMRFPLTTAFREQYAGTYPSGSSGLDKTAVMAYSGKLYDVDASISIARAKTYASVINSLNQTQRAYLDTMKSGGLLSYPVVDASNVLKNSGQGNSVAMRTYASEMFAWYAGSVDADVYFCPERQATYFGSFYMKDAPAMGNAGYSISTTLTGDSGETFISYLTDAQKEKITSLVGLSKADLAEIVSTRQKIATELRKPLSGGTIDEAAVRALSERYGELDGEISYNYATHFAEVGKTLTSDQMTKMTALRNLASYSCNGAYLYSQSISMPRNIPSDFLFGVGTYDPAVMTTWLQAQQQTIASQNQGSGTGKNPQGGKQSDAGNVTAPGPGGNGGSKGQNKGSHGANVTTTGQNPGQGQVRGMPLDRIIAQLGQQGYDISGAATAVQSDDRPAQKVWLDTFRTNNPGIVEAIESSWTDDAAGQKGGAGNSGTGNQTQRPAKVSEKSIIDAVKDWFSHL